MARLLFPRTIGLLQSCGFIDRDLTVEDIGKILAICHRIAEMGDTGIGGGGNEGLKNFPAQDKVYRNKRKSLDTPTNLPHTSLTEFPRYGSSSSPSAKPQNTSSGSFSLDLGSNQSKEITKVDDPDWSDPIVCQLEQLLSSNLYEMFRNAIKKIASYGYSEDVAEKAVSRVGVYCGGKDPISSIVDDSLMLLRQCKGIDSTRYNGFLNLQNLVEYTLLEMICVLRELKPSLSVADAMWSLLVSDMNVTKAFAAEVDLWSDPKSKEVSGESSSTMTTLPAPEKESPASCSVEKYVASAPQGVRTTQMSISEGKPGSSRKGHRGKTKRELKPQPRSSHLGKNYWTVGPNGVITSTKFPRHGGKKTLKYNVDDPGVYMKDASRSISTPVVNSHASDPSSDTPTFAANDIPATIPTKGTSSAASAAKYKLSMSLPPKTKTTTPDASIHSSSETPDYYAGIPYDKSLGKYVPRDRKDEIIMELVPRLQGLQGELQGWTDWANQKVSEAAQRLCKDLGELKALRQEKEEAERIKKDKQTLEDNTAKRLAEMSLALATASGEVEKANNTAGKLEVENTTLKKEWEVEKLRSAKLAESCQVALEREQEARKKVQSVESERSVFQKELADVKLEAAELQKEVGKAKDVLNQIEARKNQESAAKGKLLMQAASIRKEKELIKAQAKEEEENVNQRAERDLQKYREDIKSLEKQLSEIRLKAESSKIAELRRSVDGSYGPSRTNGKKAQDMQKSHTPKAPKSKRLSAFPELETGGLKQDRECVMCLSEEKSVVFLPCAHQVVCATCNKLHEKQGMKDCPSCRTPIEKRITVRYAHP